jgi:hypothetical protein
MLQSIMPISGFGMGGSIASLSWLACSTSYIRSPFRGSEKLLLRRRLQLCRKPAIKGNTRRGHLLRGDQTSTQELALAKALKPSKKFSSRMSGLSLKEKSPLRKLRSAGRGCPQHKCIGSCCTRAMLETPRMSPPKVASKTSNAPAGKGMSVLSFAFLLS